MNGTDPQTRPVYGPGELPTSIPALVSDSARRYGDAVAVRTDGRVLTFRQLDAEMRRIGRAVVAAGLRPGERAALWAPNGAEWITSAFGLTAAGLTVTTVNSRCRAGEAAELLTRSRARLLVVDHGFLGYDHLGELAKAGTELPELEHVLTLGREPVPGTRTLDEFAAGAPDDAGLPDVGPGDVAYIVFTSGTTGRAKGVQLLHGVLPRLYQDYSGIWGIRPDDRYLCPLPLFHGSGQSALLSCLIRGATFLPMAVFDAEKVFEAVERLCVTVMIGAPTVFAAMLDHPARDAYDLSSLRLAATGAAVVPVRLVERCRGELPFENFITAYGLTECHGTATMCRADDDARTVAHTNGRALPGTEVRVVDVADGHELPPGEPGEVWVRGYQVMPGYLDDPQGTAEAVDAEGWLHTGDIGTLDERGNLAITDRLKDLYICGGFNVSPAEVEQVLARHPDVSEVAVIGVPDERLGEVGRAYVVPRPGTGPDEASVIAWAREHMANFKVPRSVVVCVDLPHNTTGKVLKTTLRGDGG